ncbi:hypothetical protein Nepgr_032651 [Nepenthes gracilis]|uniref:Pentatricopeptide repeat-containing protein n=1 Tax=Nepenthes gracilis TaxID=150966 RepID=A0AAD3Y683_NEPGR|nr:hypothetical protein Nepgr_032651 [Nepenthes gracilis]
MSSRIIPRGLQLTVSPQLSISFTAVNDSLQNNRLQNARKLFDDNPTSQNIVSWNLMLKRCISNSEIHHAQAVFDKMPVRDIVSWNLLLGLQKNQTPRLYQSYLELQRIGLQPTEYTFSMVITAILGTVFSVLTPQLHAQILQFALNWNVFVGSALMRGYTNLRDHHALSRVFNEILDRDVTSWNALVLGYMDLGLTSEAQRVFNTMPDKNVACWTTMVHGYLKNKQIKRARYLFNRMKERNVISWTAMICGYVKISRYSDALVLFRSMMESGIRPNHFTFSSVLDACSRSPSLLLGEQVHANIIKCIILFDVILSTALMEMYAKCGDIEAAYCIFESMAMKNLASWNSVIGGYARHGLARRALEEFHRMSANSGLTPNNITFVNVLSACVHGGLVEEGERIFSCMAPIYGVQPDMEHYACMVNLYGRAGYLDKAAGMIKGMPLEPDVVVWGALLGACGLHSNIELGEHAAEAICNLGKDHPAVYSELSKILGEKGIWSTVIELRNVMKEKGAKKQKAGSWII